jgi:DNA (cytosine-5)-methyltransferase 1
MKHGFLQRVLMNNTYNVLDLFCGCGGLSYGFTQSGYNVFLGVDNDEMALTTFKQNHKNSDALYLDLFNSANIDVIEDYIKSRGISLDVLIGGPPCQGFSIAGPRNKNDKRNKLYKAMVRIAEDLQPKAVILENVPGLISVNGGIGAKRIVKDFNEIGYTMIPKILYAPDFAIPQIRKRVVFVGLHSGEKFTFPSPILDSAHYITCEEAIGDLPALEGIYGDETQKYMTEPFTEYQRTMRKGSKVIHNHIGTLHDEKTLRFLAMIPEGKNYRVLPKEYEGIYKYHEALTRYHSKKPSLTINTGHRSHFHYKWNRIPTVRESARLQSFPDTFIFFGNKSQQYKQVGNAVPPLLGFHLAKQLYPYLSEAGSEKN